MKIPFNKPYTTGKELEYIKEAIDSGHISGNGSFTKRCHKIFEESWGIKKALLTTSCTDALEMCAILLNIEPGDEVIVPAYTYVSTALAFKRQGATIVFADSRSDNPCIDDKKIESLISSKTKAIIPVHYGGIACEMDTIVRLAEKYGLWIVEDAANAFGSRYKGKLLGTIGHLGCFSFHETKIIHCGEGGMLSINEDKFNKRAEIIWEKGTNRCDFKRGYVSKYEWIDVGSSFLISDINAAFLYAQLKESVKIISHRKDQWNYYYKSLKECENKGFIKLPKIPEDTETNYSEFYFITRNPVEHVKLLYILSESGIQALTHYLDLSVSPYIKQNQAGGKNFKVNKYSRKYQDNLLRLPLYQDLSLEQISEVSDRVKNFFKESSWI